MVDVDLWGVRGTGLFHLSENCDKLTPTKRIKVVSEGRHLDEDVLSDTYRPVLSLETRLSVNVTLDLWKTIPCPPREYDRELRKSLL